MKEKKKTMLEELEEKYSKFLDTLKESDYDAGEWRFIHSIKTLFDSALFNLKEKNYESSFMSFCTIIEGVSAKVHYVKYSNFYDWMIKNQDTIHFDELSNKKMYKKEMQRLYEIYLQTYGIRRNFVKTITDAYLENEILPWNVHMKKIKTKEGSAVYTLRSPEEFKNADTIISDFKKQLGILYSNFRCPLTHQAKLLGPMITISSRLGGHMTPAEQPSLQSLGFMTLQTIKHYLPKMKKG